MMGTAFLFLILIIIVVFLMLTPILRKINFATSNKFNIGILVGYIVLLLVSTVIFYFIPENNYIESERSTTYDEYDEIDIYENLKNKKPVDPVFEKGKRVFDYDFQELSIKGDNPDFSNSIILEKVKELDSTIEMYIYSGMSKIDNNIITDKIPLPSFELMETTLQIEQAAPVDINFSVYKKPFTFTQFTGEKWMDSGTSSSISHSIFLIRVPENVDVSWDEHLFVDEIE